MKIHSMYSLLIVSALVVFTACGKRATFKTEGEELMSQANDLAQQHAMLNIRIDSLWDATTTALSAAIPEDFPPTDREIFLNARNADHIRMFMSFKTLDKETQALVDAAGRYDEMLASQIRSLQQQRQEFEHQKIDFLSKVADNDSSDFRYYADQFQQIASGTSK
jgi:hypothetical protein